MSTSARIAVKESNGRYQSIYLHWDGYPSRCGKFLLDFYNDKGKIDLLLQEGSLYYLGHTPWHCKTFVRHLERDLEIWVHELYEDFLNDCKEDFVYLFENSEWKIFNKNSFVKLETK